jgi:hypothetical protein
MLDARKPLLTLLSPPSLGSAAASERRAADGELIVRLAAQRLSDLGMHACAESLRRCADELVLRAEELYRSARSDEPDSSHETLLRAAALAIAHRWAQRFS